LTAPKVVKIRDICTVFAEQEVVFQLANIVRGIVSLATHLPVSPLIIVALIQVILVIMGCFIDQIAMIMIAVPIVMPISNAFGFDPVWMGLLILISISLGLLTPPFGLLLFILRGNSPEGTSMMDVYRASLSYIYPTILGLALFIIFPGNATWLPRHM
jgi:TRAP-type C4-dicarboxylate transport system permease large subunit